MQNVTNNINHQVSCLILSIKQKRDVTRKGSLSILFFYIAGFVVSIVAAVVLHSNAVEVIGFIIVLSGIGLTVTLDKKPIGWMGMTKERTN